MNEEGEKEECSTTTPQVHYYFPGAADQQWTTPTLINEIYPNGPPDIVYGLTLYGTTARERVTAKVNPYCNPVMPQEPAWLADVQTEFIDPGDPKDFPSLVDYIVYQVSVKLKTIVSCYATVVTKFSQECRRWAKDETHRPCDPEYFIQFLEIMISDVPDGVPKQRVRAWIQDMMDTIRDLHTLTLPSANGPLHICWERFPNQWPPEQIDGEYKIQSAPHVYRFPDRSQPAIEGLVITIRLIMDTQQYSIPRGFTVDVSGYSTETFAPSEASGNGGGSFLVLVLILFLVQLGWQHGREFL